MKYEVLVSKDVRKAIDKLSRKDIEKVMETIESLRVAPFLGKKLSGRLKGKYSLRVWPYRIIYEIYKKQLIVFVIDFGHRQGVYN